MELNKYTASQKELIKRKLQMALKKMWLELFQDKLF